MRKCQSQTSGLLITLVATSALLVGPSAFAQPVSSHLKGSAATAQAPTVHLATLRRAGAGPKPYTATVSYPVLSGASASVLRANAIFASQAAQLTNAFVTEVHQESVPKGVRPMESSLSDEVQTGMVSNQLVSFTTLYYEYLFPGADGNTNVASETIDMATGAPIGLPSIFKPGTDWLTALAAQARSHLLAQYAKLGLTEFIDFGTKAVASNFQGWSLTPFGLEVSFSQGQVGPEVAGPMSTMVPFSRLTPISRPGGPMAIAAALNPVRMPLLPATSFPRVDECYAAEGVATCAGGKLNVAAWDRWDYLTPVLALGPNVPEARVKAALCLTKDYGLSTVATVAQLGISYYGWSYSASSLSNLPKTCPTG